MSEYYYCIIIIIEARGSAVGWGTALQVGKSRARFPVVSFEFFIDIILPAAIWLWGDSASNRNEYQECFLGAKWPVCRADNLTTFMCRLSWNLGTSASWNPLGLSRPVMGLLYLYLYLITILVLTGSRPLNAIEFVFCTDLVKSYSVIIWFSLCAALCRLSSVSAIMTWSSANNSVDSCWFY